MVANARMTNTVQGDIQSASIGTFMAINGDGFFVVQKPSSFADNRPVFDGIDRYTRRGDFQPDKNGYLVNGAGYYLMGIPVDPTTGNLVGSVPQLLQFQNDFLPAQATTQIEYRANLASLSADARCTTPTFRARSCSIRRLSPPIRSPARRPPAKITGSGATLADAIAGVTGTRNVRHRRPPHSAPAMAARCASRSRRRAASPPTTTLCTPTPTRSPT